MSNRKRSSVKSSSIFEKKGRNRRNRLMIFDIIAMFILILLAFIDSSYTPVDFQQQSWISYTTAAFAAFIAIFISLYTLQATEEQCDKQIILQTLPFIGVKDLNILNNPSIYLPLSPDGILPEGSNIFLSITITNIGNATATNIRLCDSKQSNYLLVGDTISIMFVLPKSNQLIIYFDDIQGRHYKQDIDYLNNTYSTLISTPELV